MADTTVPITCERLLGDETPQTLGAGSRIMPSAAGDKSACSLSFEVAA